MSIAAEKLPLPHRDVRKKSYRVATAPRWFIKIAVAPLPLRDGL
jgi:hypothetical protein